MIQFFINRTAIFVLFLLLTQLECGIISDSSIEMCTQTTNSSSSLNCTEKLVLSLSIQNDELSDTNTIDAYVSSVTDTSGNTQNLENSYKINISKTQTKATYPCNYLQDFNYRPIEKVISSSLLTCSDSNTASSPTCGWAYTSDGAEIAYSQGFCCSCSFGQILGVQSSSDIRGSVDCGFLNLDATAHCLEFDSLWYSAYTIGTYSFDYSIEITVTYLNSTDNSSYVIENLYLGPSNTISVSSDKSVIATLIGSFLPDTLPTDYSNDLLLVPTSPNTNSIVQEGPVNWLVVPTNMFTYDGRTCDKIGVGYYAFNNQADACDDLTGDCLHNQIYDIYNSDLALIAANQTPTYMLFSTSSSDYTMNSYNSSYIRFSKLVTGNLNSLITLELIADNIKFVTNVANGTIDYFCLLPITSV